MTEKTETIESIQNKIQLLQRRMNSPKTDLLENDQYVIIRMELPVSSFEWELIENNNILLVTYEKLEARYQYDNLRIIYSETKYGKGRRRVKLPVEVNTTIIYDEWKDGIWTVCFEKKHNSFNNYNIDTGTNIKIDWL
jgi:HSP20 family molecular chaperone IbpA